MPKVKVVFDQLPLLFWPILGMFFWAQPIWQNLQENDVNLIKFPIEQTTPPKTDSMEFRLWVWVRRWQEGSNFEDGNQIIARLRHASDFPFSITPYPPQYGKLSTLMG